jgi:hypothetical protein
MANPEGAVVCDVRNESTGVLPPFEPPPLPTEAMIRGLSPSRSAGIAATGSMWNSPPTKVMA